MVSQQILDGLKRARVIGVRPEGVAERDQVSGGQSDYYRFNIRQRSFLAVTLTELSQNADLFLINSKGRIINRSKNRGDSSETISSPFTDRGVYFLRVVSRGRKTSYRLEVSAVARSRFPPEPPPPLTQLLLDINNDGDSDPTDLVRVGNSFFFAANDGEDGKELWVSNGTAARTRQVADINVGDEGSDPSDLVNLNGIVYFAANDGNNGRELFRSDGTRNGTFRVRDINLGDETQSSDPTDLAVLNGVLYFTANDGDNGRELYRSDGTAAGTFLVRDINVGEEGSNPTELVNVNNVLYFAATDDDGDRELYRSDGTAAGTFRIADINFGNESSNPGDLIDVNGTLFFTADDGDDGRELFRSTGVIGGTTQVFDLNLDETGSFADLAPPSLDAAVTLDRRILANVNGVLFFAANDGDDGTELWRTNGTREGTRQIRDLILGEIGSEPQELTNINGTLYFSAIDEDSEDGRELYRSDGTLSGTVQVDDINSEGDSNPADFIAFRRGVFFAATEDDDGREIRFYRPPVRAPRSTRKT